MSRPLAIDLFCGLGGWTEGLLAEGYDVVGFDIERHRYPERSLPEASHQKSPIGSNPGGSLWRERSSTGPRDMAIEDLRHAPLTGRWAEYPGQLVIQDVLTLHGSQFRDATLIVASPPCQEYSYMAQPWKLAKAKAAAIRADTTGQMLADLNRLFEACFRIQAQASLAAGRHIPMVVENVRGAQPWVGRARWNFGSFYLWGDVPALMPFTARTVKVPGFRFDGSKRSFQEASVLATIGQKGVGPSGGAHGMRRWTNPAEGSGLKCGGNWFGDDNPSAMRLHSSKSPRRKQASAMIAKIPLPLSRHIAAVYRGTI